MWAKDARRRLVASGRADDSQDIGEAEFALYGVADDADIVNRPFYPEQVD